MIPTSGPRRVVSASRQRRRGGLDDGGNAARHVREVSAARDLRSRTRASFVDILPRSTTPASAEDEDAETPDAVAAETPDAVTADAIEAYSSKTNGDDLILRGVHGLRAARALIENQLAQRVPLGLPHAVVVGPRLVEVRVDESHSQTLGAFPRVSTTVSIGPAPIERHSRLERASPWCTSPVVAGAQSGYKEYISARDVHRDLQLSAHGSSPSVLAARQRRRPKRHIRRRL